MYILMIILYVVSGRALFKENFISVLVWLCSKKSK